MSDHPFTKDNINLYLKELAKEFRKRNGKAIPAEVILIGGASVMINYGFREMTYDIDAIIDATSAMKDAINYVSDKYDLPNGWMNIDFMRTSSYTPKIRLFSKHYKTYSNIVSFRTVSGEYLVAMKLMAGRKYKYDLSDVIGILRDQVRRNEPLTLEQIKRASDELYGSYENIPLDSRVFVENAINEGDYESMYQSVRQMETENKDILVQFQDEYPGNANTDNVEEIIKSIREKRKNEKI